MKLEEGCAQIAGGFEVELGRVIESVKRALGRAGWEEGGYEFDDWETDLSGRSKMVIRRFTHEMNGRPLWPDIVDVTLTTNGRVRAVYTEKLQSGCEKGKLKIQWSYAVLV